MSPGINGGSNSPRGAIHHASLIAGVTTALSLSIILWNTVRTMVALHTRSPKELWWNESAVLILGAITLTLPVFYFCLFTDRGTLVLSERLRALSLAGALALSAITAIGIPAVVRGLTAGRQVSLFALGDPPVLSNLSNVLGELSNIAAILVLFALYRSQRDDSRPREPGAKLLRTIAMITAIGWGLAVLFATVQVFLNPLVYLQYRNVPQLAGIATAATLSKATGNSVRFLLAQFGLFVGPYVVWRAHK